MLDDFDSCIGVSFSKHPAIRRKKSYRVARVTRGCHEERTKPHPKYRPERGVSFQS